VIFLAQIDIQGVQDTISTLRKFEPDLYKQLIKDIKNEPGVNEVMSGIRSRIPVVSPLQGNQFGYGGMNHNGRTSYKIPKVSVQATPSKRLNFANERSIVTIQVLSPKNGVGFEIIDMVGRGQNANTRQAQGMRRKLAGSPSRYVWKGFEERREGVTRAIVSILDRYSQTVNVKLKVK
jgi:hypothetical protein